MWIFFRVKLLLKFFLLLTQASNAWCNFHFFLLQLSDGSDFVLRKLCNLMSRVVFLLINVEKVLSWILNTFQTHKTSVLGRRSWSHEATEMLKVFILGGPQKISPWNVIRREVLNFHLITNRMHAKLFMGATKSLIWRNFFKENYFLRKIIFIKLWEILCLTSLWLFLCAWMSNEIHGWGKEETNF